MRWLPAWLCALVVVAACGTSGTTPGVSPAAVPTPPPAESTATAAPSEAATPTAYKARLTFDGKKCEYTGATTLKAPATLILEYAPTPAMEGSGFMVSGVRSDITMADMTAFAAAHPHGWVPDTGEMVIPDWVYVDASEGYLASASPVAYEAGIYRTADGTYDQVEVACLSAVANGDVIDAALLKLVP
jgi:hypothetical protein